jgi:hypothetical protein
MKENEMKRNGGKRECRERKEVRKISGVGGSVGFTSRPFFLSSFFILFYLLLLFFYLFI